MTSAEIAQQDPRRLRAINPGGGPGIRWRSRTGCVPATKVRSTRSATTPVPPGLLGQRASADGPWPSAGWSSRWWTGPGAAAADGPGGAKGALPSRSVFAMRLPGDTVEVLADSGWAWRTISDDRSYNVKTNRPPHPDLRPVSTGTPMSPEASRRHSRQGSGSLTRTGTAWFIAHDMRRLNRLHWVMGPAAPRVQPPMQVLKLSSARRWCDRRRWAIRTGARERQTERPHLPVLRRLHDSVESPWFLPGQPAADRCEHPPGRSPAWSCLLDNSIKDGQRCMAIRRVQGGH